MIKFIKSLFGFGNTEPQETVKEILTPEPQLITRIAVPESNPSVVVTPVKAKPAVQEGKTRANVKKPNSNNAKPPAPPRPAPKAKAKSKPKAKRK